MYAVEFQAPIENGIVHIPKQYQEIQNSKKATFVVMYNNKVQVTMELATSTDEMVNDGIL